MMDEPANPEPHDAITPATSEAARPASEASQTERGSTARLSLGEKFLLATSFLLFALLVMSQLWVVASLTSWVGLWIAASRSTLHSGGLAVPDAAIGVAMKVGAGLAALCLFGAIARWISGRLHQGLHRQRVIGPGGRVLRVIHTPKGETTTHPILSWIPDAATLFSLTFILIRVIRINRWLPASVPCALVLANLYLFSLYAPLWFGRLGIGAFFGLYRFARRTGFRAGAITVLLLILVGTTVGLEVHAVQSRPPSTVTTTANIPSGNSISTLQREVLFAIADDLWPEEAFVAGLRRFLDPLFEAARDPYDLQFGRNSFSSHPALLAMAGGGIALAEPGSTGTDTFDTCVLKLYPRITSRAERGIIGKYHQLKREDGYDIAIQVLLNICDNHTEKGPYPNLEAAYWKAIGREANKRVDPTRKYRREVGESALNAPGIDCDASSGHYYERCPSPWESPEERTAAMEEVAQVRWQELSRLQCTVILQKAVLGYSDDEIAVLHNGMTPDKAKDTYQNARRKIRNGMAGSCTRLID